MKRWAWVVAGLYFLILAGLTVPAIFLAMVPTVRSVEAVQVYVFWPYWVWLGVMILAQWVLLMVPVRMASGRPVTQRALWPTIVVGALMASGLVVGGVFSIWEFVEGQQAIKQWSWLVAGALLIGIWGLWSFVFRRISRQTPPADFVSLLCDRLFRGSILELLIAVPTHIVARYRNYCCAGFMTFIGLTMGISVMLFSFGPAVYFLYVERWRRLHPERQPE